MPLGPHDVPSGTAAPVSLQTSNPVAQSTRPPWQAFSGVQDDPPVLQQTSPPQTPPGQAKPVVGRVHGPVSIVTGPLVHEPPLQIGTVRVRDIVPVASQAWLNPPQA